jgi:phosphoribosyl 1,2-cyclic phosphodiesterase
MNWIKFVGTAGARWVVAKQLRSSGGIWISLQGTHLFMDPGPGALVRCLSSQPPLDPTHLDGILLSHKHLDHAGDVNALIEAMTEGGYRQRGVLFATEDALESDPVVFRYLRSYVRRIEILKEYQTYHLRDLCFSTARRHLHSVETYGVNFLLPRCTVSFITDTKFYPELIQEYPGKVLLLNVVLLTEPSHPIDHLSLKDVETILKESPAEVVVLTHFGLRFLEAGPQRIAERLSQDYGKRVIAAEDGMVIELDPFLRP